MSRAVLLTVALAVLLLHNVAIRTWMLDDAFISFRYAENLAAGNGIVYNPGERVEGYTCFLWVVLLALGAGLGLDVPVFSQILGGVFSAGTLLLVFFAYRITERFTPRAAALAAVLLGTCGIFTPWAISGMEVTLFSFLALLSLLLAAKPELGARTSVLSGAALALLSLTRPEGLLIASIVLSDLLVRKENRAFLITAAVFCAIYVPYFLWRYSYYGYLLPNTFYAKVGSTLDQAYRGFRYAGHFAVAALPLVVLYLASIPGSWKNGFRAAALTVAAYSGYVIAVGGDIMPAFRFFAPIVPVLCLIAARFIDRLPRTRTLYLVVLLAAGYNLMQIRHHPHIRDYILTDTVAKDGREVGLWLKENARPDAWIATNTGGSVPYFSELRSVDMLGLNDTHIAHRQISWIGKGPAGHEKGDGAYVLWRRPDYIQFGSSLGDSVPRFLSDQELWALPEFHRIYVLRKHKLPSGKEMMLFERTESGNAP